MKKIGIALALIVSFVPTFSYAALGTLDGLNAKDQFITAATGTNSLHATIVTVGSNTHQIQWDGSALRIDQGGTGVLTLPTGILAGNGTSAIGLVTVNTPLTYASNQIGCQTASASQDGCISAADWTRFNATASSSATAPAGGNRQVQFNNNGAFGAASKFVYDPVTGFFAVGTSTQYRFNELWEFMSQTTGNTGTNLTHTNYDTVSPFAAFSTRGARGTMTNPTAVQNGDTLGAFTFSGFDGSSFPSLASARMRARAGETWTSTAHGSFMSFDVTPNGTVTRTEAMRINPSGGVMIGTTTGPGKLSVEGDTYSSFGFSSPGYLKIAGPTLLGTTTNRARLTVDQNGAGIAAYFDGGINLVHGNINIEGGCFSVNDVCITDGGSGSGSQFVTEGNNVRFPTTNGILLLGAVATTTSSSAPGMRLSVHGHSRFDGNIDLYGYLKLPALAELGTDTSHRCLQANILPDLFASGNGAVSGTHGPCLEKEITPALGVFPITFWGNTTVISEAQNLNWDSIHQRLAIGTVSPAYPLDISSSATTTIRIDTTSLSHGTCIIMKDSDGGGYTYITTVNHQLVASDIPCE